MQKMAYNNNEVIKLSKTFPVIYEIDEDGYFVVTCSVFKGCYPHGETIEEAKEILKKQLSYS